VGADQLAVAMGAAGAGGAEALRGAAAVVGERLLRAVGRIAAAPRAGALGPVRAAIARCRVALDERALVVIGARAIAPHTDALARRQIAVRLPSAVGMAVAEAMERAAGAGIDQAPAWRALAAPYG
jgi:hypothetical protein